VVKLELLKSLHYCIHHHNSIAMWNRTTVISSIGLRRCNRADSRLESEVPVFRHKLAMLSLRDSIHGVDRIREVRLNRVRGSHAASPLRWRGSFWGSFMPRVLKLAGSSLALKFFLYLL